MGEDRWFYPEGRYGGGDSMVVVAYRSEQHLPFPHQPVRFFLWKNILQIC